MGKSKAGARRGRGYWAPLVAEFEAAPCRHEVFAARRKINVGTFRSWLYQLRADEARAPRKVTPKFVEVVAPTGEPGCTVTVGGVELRFERRPDPEYLAELLVRAAR